VLCGYVCVKISLNLSGFSTKYFIIVGSIDDKSVFSILNIFSISLYLSTRYLSNSLLFKLANLLTSVDLDNSCNLFSWS